MTKKDAPDLFEDVFKEELTHIKKTPGKKGSNKDNLVSLSISGGGIRSAALGLGVIHALVANDKLSQIDYLSTVSGGGFIGSALTWALHKKKDEGKEILETSRFPLGQPGEGSHTSKINDGLNYIRQQTNYLCPGKGLNLLSAIAVSIRGLILGTLAYFPLLAFLLYIIRPWQLGNIYIKTSLGLATAFVVVSMLFSFLTYLLYRFYFNKARPSAAIHVYKLRNFCQNILGKGLFALGFFLYVWSLKPVSEFLQSHSFSMTTTSLSSIVGYVGFMIQFLMGRSSKKKQSTSSNLLATVFAFLFIYGLSLFAYMIAEFHLPILWVSLIASLLIGLCVNINMVGLHRMYRDRLMETFMPDDSMVDKQQWNIAKDADEALLSTMCDTETPGPYHICCATVILKNSNDRKVRGRLGDSFILSPLFCGSFATHWQKTTEFMKGKMHLSTAMAISGAAANPNAACKGQGLTATPLVAFIMTLLNIRLGYWAPNPNHKSARRGWTPNFYFPGLQDLLGYGYTEHSPFLELTDGVNFENLALYEMIRRKVKIAIVSDGGADNASTFESLGNAIEKVRVDFGVNILFNDPDYDLKWLLVGSGDSGVFQTQYGTAKRGFAIGSIYYPDGSEGKLLYLKAAIIDDLPADIYGYKSTHCEFPNESTSDQFFTEQQFEAYRELGYRLSSKLFSRLDKNWNLKKED